MTSLFQNEDAVILKKFSEQLFETETINKDFKDYMFDKKITKANILSNKSDIHNKIAG